MGYLSDNRDLAGILIAARRGKLDNHYPLAWGVSRFNGQRPSRWFDIWNEAIHCAIEWSERYGDIELTHNNGLLTDGYPLYLVMWEEGRLWLRPWELFTGLVWLHHLPDSFPEQLFVHCGYPKSGGGGPNRLPEVAANDLAVFASEVPEPDEPTDFWLVGHYSSYEDALAAASEPVAELGATAYINWSRRLTIFTVCRSLEDFHFIWRGFGDFAVPLNPLLRVTEEFERRAERWRAGRSERERIERERAERYVREYQEFLREQG